VSTRFHIFMLLLLTPFLGMLLGFIIFDSNNDLPINQIGFEQAIPDNMSENVLNNVPKNMFAENIMTIDMLNATAVDVVSYTNETRNLLSSIRNTAQHEIKEYQEQVVMVESLLQTSKNENKNTAGVLDQILANILGEPIGQTFGDKAIIKVYSLEEAGYRGYMAKVRIIDPKAIKMVLANDKLASQGETTSQAAKRANATLAVNAGGGFYSDGFLRPLGITVIDGEIKAFSNAEVSFVGFNQSGNLVGGKIASESDIKEMGIQNGASFLPTLLKNSEKQPIPKDWQNARQPRTIIGHFQNGDLLIIVIDGRRQGWSVGVTLEEAQDKLLEFKVRDAYNLDGGGSSTFYYNGKVLNKPSDGSERRVPTNLVIIP